MQTEDTEINGEPTDERTEERANADPLGVETPNLGLTENGTSSMIGTATDRTNRTDQRGVIQVMGPVGIADVAGCLGRGETRAATTVSNDIEHQ